MRYPVGLIAEMEKVVREEDRARRREASKARAKGRR